jgi:hypothetical protein
MLGLLTGQPSKFGKAALAVPPASADPPTAIATAAANAFLLNTI